MRPIISPGRLPRTLGHRFLTAAHKTFELLAGKPGIGWKCRLQQPDLASVRVFRISGFEKMLVLYRPFVDGIEILRVVHSSRDLEAFLRREGLE